MFFDENKGVLYLTKEEFDDNKNFYYRQIIEFLKKENKASVIDSEKLTPETLQKFLLPKDEFDDAKPLEGFDYVISYSRMHDYITEILLVDNIKELLNENDGEMQVNPMVDEILFTNLASLLKINGIDRSESFLLERRAIFLTLFDKKLDEEIKKQLLPIKHQFLLRDKQTISKALEATKQAMTNLDMKVPTEKGDTLETLAYRKTIATKTRTTLTLERKKKELEKTNEKLEKTQKILKTTTIDKNAALSAMKKAPTDEAIIDELKEKLNESNAVLVNQVTKLIKSQEENKELKAKIAELENEKGLKRGHDDEESNEEPDAKHFKPDNIDLATNSLDANISCPSSPSP